MDGVRLHFTDDAIDEIAEKSLQRKTGARGLRSIMESVMMDYMYTIPSDDSITELTITKEMVDKNTLFIDKNDSDITEIQAQNNIDDTLLQTKKSA